MNFKNTDNKWGIVSVSIHWITALSVIGMFILGLWMVDLSYYSQWYQAAPFVHKSIGILLLLLTVFRLAWRLFAKTPKPLDTHNKYERVLAHLMHIALYALLFAIFISGYLISTADGRSISVFGLFEVGATITSIPNQEDVAGEIHEYLAFAIIIFAFMHAAAAIKHHVIDKDSTLKRMLGMNSIFHFK